MNLWGKIIGTATGFALAGPSGAIAGGLAGHALDIYTAWAEEQARRPYPSGGPGSERRNPASRYNFTVAVVTLSAKLAKVDGPVNRNEINAFKEVFRVPPEETASVGRIFDQARQSVSGFEASAIKLKDMFEAHRTMLDEVINSLFFVALADGPIKQEEVDFLWRVAKIFGFSDTYFQRRLADNTGHGQSTNNRTEIAANPYRVLRLSSSSTDEEVRIAYRRLVRQYHPDRLMAHGKNKDAIDNATSELVQINAAYEQILKERSLR